MTAPVFVDTNVIVYRYDATDPRKRSRAVDWLPLLWNRRSGQGVSEILCLDRLGRVCSIRWDSWHCSSLGRAAPNSPTGIRPRAGARSDFHVLTTGAGSSFAQAPVGRRWKSRRQSRRLRHEPVTELENLGSEENQK